MRVVLLSAFALIGAGVSGSPARAHFHILLVDSAHARRGEDVTISYCWGHPFEHQLFPVALPQSWIVLGPEGSRTDLLPGVRKATQGQPEVVGARFSPKARGDY